MGQLQALFEYGHEGDYEEVRIQAGMHGVDIEGEEKKGKGESRVEHQQSIMTFGAPGSYDHLTQEQREELTKKMMAHWIPWAEGAGKFLGGQ